MDDEMTHVNLIHVDLNREPRDQDLRRKRLLLTEHVAVLPNGSEVALPPGSLIVERQ